VALTALTPATVRPTAGERYAVTGTVSVSGPAKASVQDVTYTVSGAEFVTGSGTSTTVTRPVAQTAPTFTLTHPGAAKVTITASVPGFHDTLSLNDSTSADLSPYDVALTGLTPLAVTADQSGDQRFTATVQRDGFAGKLDYAPVGFPSDLSMTTTEAGDQVTFTVHSATKDQPATDFAVRVGLPAGFTDYVPGNDTASSTYVYGTTPPPSADVRVSSSQNMNGQSGTGKVFAQVSAPTGVDADLKVTYDPDKVTVTGPAGCTTSLGAITCRLSGGVILLQAFDVDLVDRNGNVSRSATIGFAVTVASPYVDPVSGNDTASETVTRR
jgi:hypothetical protein